MATQIFVNLPVKDLKRSIEFFGSLGFEFNPQFTDETATCMIVAENIFVMLLTEAKFRSFTPHPICDAKQSTEVLVCLSRDSRQAIDSMVGAALAAGGTTHSEPQDHGFMYAHAFQDLDGHIWELVHMSGMPGGASAARAISRSTAERLWSSASASKALAASRSAPARSGASSACARW